VFIDPIGTGYSRSLVPALDAKTQFYTTITTFITSRASFYDWLVANGARELAKIFRRRELRRLSRPRITHYLQTQLGVAMKWCGLVSPYLNPAIEDNRDISPVPWMMTLPSITAGASGARSTADAGGHVAPVIAYTRGEYAADLLKAAPTRRRRRAS